MLNASFITDVFLPIFLALPLTPVCSQVFNLFLPFDPVASRLEPLIDQSYSTVEPVHVPRYQSFPFNTEILYNNYNKHPVVSAMDARDPHSPCTPTLMASRKESSNGFGSNSSVDTLGPSSRIIDNGNTIFYHEVCNYLHNDSSSIHFSVPSIPLQSCIFTLYCYALPCHTLLPRYAGIIVSNS